MKMLVLAGGLGTRLKSAVADRPKALAPVNGAPFLLLQLQHWRHQGIRDFLFLLHHQADQIIAFLEDAKRGILHDCTLTWVIEPEPLDTGGAVAHALRVSGLQSDFLLTNADTWLGDAVADVMANPEPSLAIIHRDDTGRYGRVNFDERGFVTAFLEKSPGMGEGWINAGLCHLSPELFDDWDGRPFSLERQLFQSLITDGKLRTTQLKTDFIDIGVPEDYYRFCQWVGEGAHGPLCS